ncbi:hypothetical protein TruAng_009557 [Truncatella angustata]|nr:hypothetical protein TruAng_009557 [Truncatella angustata]
MDDDSRSSGSFEEIGPRAYNRLGADDYKPIEEKTKDQLKSLVAKSTSDGAKAIVANNDALDVVYTLQYKERYGGRVTELCRSTDPIDIRDVTEKPQEGITDINGRSILEIITSVSTTFVDNNRSGNPQPMYMAPPGYEDDFDYNYPPPPMPSQMYKREENDDIKIKNVEETVMVINSAPLINALQAVVDYYPGLSFSGDSVKISAPYHVLVHHRHALASFKVRQPETHDQEYSFTTARHIDVLLRFLERTLGKDLRDEEQRNNHVAGPKTIFKNLWMLFKPGDVVYARLDGRPSDYKLDVWNLSILSKSIRRLMYTFSIAPFAGEDSINNMKLVPARFLKESHEIARENIKLGKIAWELAMEPSYMSYDGDLSKRGPNQNWIDTQMSTGHFTGRVIVDCEGFYRFSGGANHQPPRMGRPRHQVVPPKDPLPYFKQRCGCIKCSRDESQNKLHRFAKLEDLRPGVSPAPENDLCYLVLSKIVSGFILSERRWAHFHIKHLGEVKHDREAFKYLVLDEEIKLTVKALIGKFSSDNGQVTPWPSDFVKNKGQGRIFLLHGSPGVGKTATAESIAELARRPLLALTSGDLSTNSLHVEKNLEYFLQLGERFGAMVLLDEADVYLESRRAKDIARNGLVSIFLRALEYYRGVLFLTTNRVQTFDSAFTSRIHVALHYKTLTDADREKIWLNSFERLERDSGGKVHVSVATREYAYESEDVQSLRLNGREIRNALQTTVALAETEALEDDASIVTVSEKHLRAVVKMSRGFKNFLHRRRVRNNDELDEDDEDDDIEEEDVYSRASTPNAIYD